MASRTTVAAVTGANKGIGLAIVRNLALEYPNSPLNSGPFLIYLTARSPERGAEAVQTLNSDPQLKEARVLKEDGGNTTIEYYALDISQTKSVHGFRDHLQKQHPDGIDILINNAGIALDGFDANIVRSTLATNYYGTLEASQSILPLLRRGGRLVNVTSTAGRLDKYPDELRNAFRSASQTSIPAVTSLMERFQSAVEERKQQEAGFPSSAYAVSKTGETAYTKVLASEESKRNTGVLVNACCPDFVVTDMTKQRGRKTPDQGAKTPVMLALADIRGETGEYWRNEEITEW